MQTSNTDTTTTTPGWKATSYQSMVVNVMFPFSVALIVGLLLYTLAKIDHQSARIDTMSARIDNLSDRIDNLSDRMGNLSDRMERLAFEVAEIKVEVAEIKSEVLEIKTNQQKLIIDFEAHLEEHARLDEQG